MGLDQYAYARKGGDSILICEWRKHADLQGWMETLYKSRGGKEVFNCIDLKLSEDELLRLKNTHRNLEQAEGFFWGESSAYKQDATEAFITDALDYIKRGYTIVYSSWW